MSDLHILQAIPLTADGFAPYGSVTTSQPADPDGRAVTGVKLQGHDFSGGAVSMSLITYRWRDLSFTHLEQHAAFTQAFLPADGKPAIWVVALPVDGPGSDPNLNTAKAFILDGAQGIMFHKGVWHVGGFPLAEKATYALVTCVDTPKESEGYLDVSKMAGAPFKISL
jgi:ureidoglycolate lyase